MHRFRGSRRALAGVSLLGAAVLGVPMTSCSGARAADPRPALRHTSDSPAGLAGAVLDGYARRDLEGLRALALSEQEFLAHVWPELPASRPERNTPFEFVWGSLHQKSDNSLRRLLRLHGGRRYRLLGIEFREGSTPYETFVVHREAVLRLRDEQGAERTLALFGSVLQRGGEYKLFSYVAD